MRERPAADLPFGEFAAIDAAVARGVHEALVRHKRLGQSIYVWEQGRVVEIPPDDIVADERRG